MQPETEGTTLTLDGLAHAAAERARGALQTLMGDVVTVSRAGVASADDASWLFASRESAADVCRLEISGPPDGAAWIHVPATCVERLMDRHGLTHGDRDRCVATSIAAELANVVTGSYVVELGNRWGVDLDPTPAQLGLPAGSARRELEAWLRPERGSGIAVTCDLADVAGSYDLRVLLILESPTPAPDAEGGP